MKPPSRWIEDEAAPNLLRRDLEAAGRPPEGFDLDRAVRRFEAALVLLPAVSAVTVTSAASAAKLAPWVIAVMTAGGLGTGAYLLAADSPPKPVASVQRPAMTPPLRLSSAPSPAADVPVPALAPSVSPKPRPPRAAVPKRIPVMRPAAPKEEVLDGLVRREVAHLGRTRAMLERDPSSALRLAEEGHASFEQGILREEREALALFALARLGRTDELKDRGERYLTHYPRGPFAERVRSLLHP
ncbi:MAG TPA: hypothetical protein VEY30_13980 [Myxococcaceae bacterium]|nr:hypothetical protein [Myxococcaceae bacterium]